MKTLTIKESCEKMFAFKPIKISDRALFNEYLSIHKYPNSEYNFTTFFAWENMNKLQYAIIENCLVIKGIYKGNDYCYFPLGQKDDFPLAFETVHNMFAGQDKPLILTSLSDEMISQLDELNLLDQFYIHDRRDFYDYIYTHQSLVDLKGKKLHGKRNHLNYFQNNYAFSLEDITKENELECGDLLTRLIFDRSNDKEDELTATARVLKYRDDLNLTGKCLYVNGQLAGVILGEDHHGVALIQIAKADIAFRGASVALFKLFLEEQFPHCEYVNFMEDMGLEGLRKAKLSYHPEKFVEKKLLCEKGYDLKEFGPPEPGQEG